MRKVICPYCGVTADYIDSAAIYGKSYGMIYICPLCAARVGTHKGTDKPLGRLANERLRKLKQESHKALDAIWRSGELSRKGVYKWLSKKMKLSPEKTHIGLFDERQCYKVIKLCQERNKNVKYSSVNGKTGK